MSMTDPQLTDADDDGTPTPDRWGFISLMRQISAQHPEHPPVGRATRPQQEPYRLGQIASLTFAPREIARVRKIAGIPHIDLYGMGLLGPNGPMPLHFSDYVRERSEVHQDHTLANFLNLFHHRYLTSLYRAWAISQSAAGLDRPQDEAFSRYVDALGHSEAAHPSPLPAHARLAASVHLVREARNPDGLTATLRRFFGVPVSLEEYVPRWISMGSRSNGTPEGTYLGHAGTAGLLGIGAIAGEMIFDRQHNFRLTIGPLSLADYLSFTPHGHNLPLLVEWVRAFVGFEYAWEAQIMVSPNAAPPARLGGDEQLGWSTWLGHPDPDIPVCGMVFEPELAKPLTQASAQALTYPSARHANPTALHA